MAPTNNLQADETPAAPSGWGAPAPVAPVAQVPQPAPAAGGWGAPAPQPTSGGWNTSGGW
jgi:hypothetical protein